MKHYHFLLSKVVFHFLEQSLDSLLLTELCMTTNALHHSFQVAKSYMKYYLEFPPVKQQCLSSMQYLGQQNLSHERIHITTPS